MQSIFLQTEVVDSETLIEEGREEDPRVIDDESSIKQGYAGEEQLTIPMFQKYVAWSKRHIHPVLNEEARDEIVNFYLETRNKSDGEDNSVPITARALEGLVRLSEANARMRLSKVATIDDAKTALAMFRNWRYELMGDEFDEGTILTGRSVKKRSADQTVLEVITDLSAGQEFDINEDDIYNEMARRDFNQFEIEEALKQLSQRSQIYTPGAGRWRLVN